MVVMKEFPLGLPKGSVRAILALVIVIAAIAGVFLLPADAAGLLLALAGVVTTAYFGERNREENGDPQ